MSVKKLSGPSARNRKPYRVRWRELDGRQRSKSFETKGAALAFERRRLVQPEELSSDVLVSELAENWLKTKQNLRFKTVEACTNSARHVVAEFGDYPAVNVKPSDVKVWLGQMQGSASLRRQALHALRAMLQLAVDDGDLTRNPTDRIDPPIARKRDPMFLNAAELLDLADAGSTVDDQLMILTMGTTGARIGEAAGFQCGDLDAVRERLRVRRTVGKGRVGEPKTHQARDLPLMPSLAARLAEHGYGRPADEPLFRSPRGSRIDPDNWRKNAFAPAAKAVGREGMHPHELRHAAASLAIQSGADVKMVQRMLGHASAAMTTDLYGHLWEHGLGDVARRMSLLLDVPPALD